MHVILLKAGTPIDSNTLVPGLEFLLNLRNASVQTEVGERDEGMERERERDRAVSL